MPARFNDIACRWIFGVALLLAFTLLRVPSAPADEPKQELPKGTQVVPFEVKNLILLKGSINEMDALWVLDTGWTHSTVTPEAAQKAGLKTVPKPGYKQAACTYGT